MAALQLPKVTRLMAFPMQKGELRGFCTILKMAVGSKVVSAPLIEEWLTFLTSTVLGGGLSTRHKNLGYPKPLIVGNPVEAVLRLEWLKKIPGQSDSFAHFSVRGVSNNETVVEGDFTVIVPP
ncbi:MAG TPA: hypothetical protein VHD31_02395 [Candidatus Paceibacterota bacterium]|nr:hypothetical protein [Candidatus Paceibacterota bacterium]